LDGCTCWAYSINTLTLFGLVLAIGIVVDDANRGSGERRAQYRTRAGSAPRGCLTRPMKEVSGPIVAIALVLWRGVRSDGLPPPGVTGQFYKQFRGDNCHPPP